jgi:flagellar protein FlgJ
MIAAISAASTTPDTAQHRRLVDAAQQFEGLFLQQMLKPMNEIGKDDPDANPDGGDNSTMQSYGTEAVAKAISAAGGLGIAREVVAKLEPVATKHPLSATSPATFLKSRSGTPIESGRRLP